MSKADWYLDYLNTDHWRTTRTAKLEQVGYRCERCGEPARRITEGRWAGLHVHHLTYDRLHNERLDDLQVLCVVCHQDEHGIAVATDEARQKQRRKITNYVINRTVDSPDHGDLDEIDREIAAWDALETQEIEAI